MAAACAIQEVEPTVSENDGEQDITAKANAVLATNNDGSSSDVILKQGDPTTSVMIAQEPEKKEMVTSSDLQFMNKVEESTDFSDSDLDRRSGKVPSRKRSIPFKFRDYRNPDMLNENGEHNDSDYEPEKEFRSTKRKAPASSVVKSTSKRGRGRPKKTITHATDVINANSGNSIQMQDMNIVIIQAIGDAQNAVLQQGGVHILPAPPVSGNQTPGSLTLSPGPTGDAVIKPLVQGSNPTVTPGGSDGEKPKNAQKTKGISSHKKLECKICFKQFSTKGNLRTHEKGHMGEKPFACDIEGCGKSFRSNEGLRRHKMSHMGIKPFQCEICHNKFSCNVSLQEHIARHTDSRPHQCHVCLRNFRQISCLRRHLYTHSSETPYQCTICSRRFSQNMYLRSHMKTHTGERPFKCVECGKSFAHQSDLIRHKIIHTGEKPFVCEVCHSRFSDPSSKRRHEREHVGTKPYVCQLCYESFKRAGQLKAHLSRKHTNQKDEVQVLRTSTGNLQFVYKDGTCETAERTSEMVADPEAGQSEVKKKKIVKLIKDLNSSIVHQYQINLPPHDYLASDYDKSLNGNQDEEFVTVQNVVLDTLQEQNRVSGIGITEIPEASRVQNLPISTYQNGDSQVITIAEVMDGDQSKTSNVPVEYLQIIEELVPDSLEQQVVEVHYQDSANTLESLTEDIVQDSNVTKSQDVGSQEVVSEENVILPPPEITDDIVSEPLSKENSSSTVESNVDFVSNPDFSSQPYYNWLSSFTELCKVMPMPLDVSLFQKISQVHKTLSDVMATPSGVVAEKENFKILMNISKELNTIINEHLFYVMQKLDTVEGSEMME